MKKLILASLLLAGCTKHSPGEAQASSIYDMKCHKLHHQRDWLFRCANFEAICYEKYQAMSCFKRL